MTFPDVRREIAEALPGDLESRAKVEARIADILRPPGALSRLDDIAAWIGEWQRTPFPDVQSPAAVIFAADHGVVKEGVSAYPAEVTGAMLAAFEASKASVSAMAAVAGASVSAIDVGVGQPTGNLRVEPALSHERFSRTFEAGRSAIRDIDADLLIVGEMGIGNTTAAAAVSAALLGSDATPFVGRGTGIDDAGLAMKKAVVADALERIDGIDEPLEILRQVGGAELVAMAGALVEARMRSIPVLLDGYIATSPAVVLHAIEPALVANCRAGHRSSEPGHGRLLAYLGLEPLLTLDMRLGEASGAMAAVPLVKMACKLVTDVATFTEWFGSNA
ncbi:MAG: nicotinate-nucleotide--dimethylbenzimidazole phosphoribosyltransferase [Verrucomicrobiales bacterium]|jgi:nicotinate-nucleotide--dimethylbenzimidazole phosphoribosyltransferase